MRDLISILFLALVLIGCSSGFVSDSNASEDVAIPDDVPGAGGSLKLMQAGSASVASASLKQTISQAAIGNGTYSGGWLSKCVASQGGESTDINLIVVINDAYEIVSQYSDSQCHSKKYQIIKHYKFASEGTKPADNGLATGLHSVVQSIQLKVLDNQSVSDANNNCDVGSTNPWSQVGDAREVSGTTCFTNVHFDAGGKEYRSIFNTNGQTLRLGEDTGDGNDGSSDAKRYRHLAEQNDALGDEYSLYYFTRQ